MQRTIFSEEHQLFRASARRFFEDEVAPHREKFETQGYVDRSIWERAGELGFLCTVAPPELGGAGCDRKFSAVILEGAAYAGQTGPAFWLHSDMATPYILHYGTGAQKTNWIPQLASGKKIMAIAMSEPGGGSNRAAIRTRADLDGDDYIINGSKIFISNGYLADLVLVVAKTDLNAGAKGISLFLVESDTPGFNRGKLLKKLGMKAQDTAELFFEDMRVPKESLLGEVGKGFAYLMTELAWERTLIAIQAIAVIEKAIADTYQYASERDVFGMPLSQYQNTQFKLADYAMAAKAARVFVDDCIQRSVDGTLDAVTAAMAKAWVTELEGKVLDGCVQLHGGYGFIWDYPITRAFADARSQRIVGGTNEIMRQIIAKSMPKVIEDYGL